MSLWEEVENRLVDNFASVGSGYYPYIPVWFENGWETDALDSHLRESGVSLFDYLRDDIDHRYDMAYNYCNQVDGSKGDAGLIVMLTNWFTTEDLIFYGIRYDSDAGYMLSYWNPRQKKRFKSKPGKFYRAFFGRTERHQQWFAEDWDQCVQESQDVHNQYTVTIHSDPQDIADEYILMRNTDNDSCCTKSANAFETAGIHPCRVYGGDSGVNLAVVRDKDNPEYIAGRTLIYQDKWVRIYPPGYTQRISLVENVLRAKGIADGKTSLLGAKLNYIEHPEQSNLVVCPYIDCEVGNASCVDVQVSREGKKQLVVVDDGFDTHQSDFYATASFDWVTYERANAEPEYDCECNQCGDGFYSDDGDCVVIDNGEYCSRRCAEQDGLVWAYISASDCDWCNDDETLYYNGEHFHHEALDLHDLVMVESGEIYPISECYSISGVGWFPMSDVRICHTMADFRQGSEQKRITVWCPDAMATGKPLTGQDLEDYGYRLFELSDRVQFLAFQKECKDELLDVVQHQLTTSQQPF